MRNRKSKKLTASVLAIMMLLGTSTFNSINAKASESETVLTSEEDNLIQEDEIDQQDLDSEFIEEEEGNIVNEDDPIIEDEDQLEQEIADDSTTERPRDPLAAATKDSNGISNNAGSKIETVTGQTAEELVTALLGEDVSIVEGSAKLTYADSSQVGVFSNGEELLGIDAGLVMSTGNSVSAFTVSVTDGDDFDYSIIDEDLQKLAGEHPLSGDTAILEFSIIADGPLLSFEYVFGSCEFGQPPKYNDVFGLFVKVNDGTYENIALLESGLPVNITNLIKSGEYTADAGNLNSAFNGISNLLTAQKSVAIEDTVTLKFAIGDVSDDGYASSVMIQGGSVSFATKYEAKIKGGTGSGRYEENKSVTISANEASNTKVFKEWVVVSGNITLADPTNPTTTFTMPAEAVEIKAIYDEQSQPSIPSPTLPSKPSVSGSNEEGKVKVVEVRAEPVIKDRIGSRNIISSFKVKDDVDIADISVKVGRKYANEDVYVLQLNEEKNELELVSISKVNEKGVATFNTSSKEAMTMVSTLPTGFIDTMATSEVSSVTYYVDENHSFKKGWLYDEAVGWYFMDYKTAIKQEDRWIADGKDENGLAKWYCLDSNGKMYTNTWIYDKVADRRYYVDAEGLYIRDLY